MNELILPLVQTLGVGVLSIVGTWLAVHVKNKLLRDALIGATRRGGGIAYDYLAARSQGMDPETARREAFNAGVAYVHDAVPGFIAALGVKGATIDDMVRGELGQLLARDAAISVAAKVQPPP